ncbi:MAG: type II toxin-antitoxin system HipA family toxin [Burkholderiales bacterium]|nr:type II toxin-antitoxin system HipA family toxin [Burkholderiales bacterium]
MLPERMRLLDIDLNGRACGRLQHGSVYNFSYGKDDPTQAALSLLMPPTELMYEDGALFPAMDMNLPEGFLFQQIRELFPKQPITPMHLLALVGNNGIGRIGYGLPDTEPGMRPATIDKAQLLKNGNDQGLFAELTRAYLSTGAGISGIQPKIMLPDRATVPIPTLIVKLAAERYPGLSANEFLCLSAARMAGIETPSFDLSQDGQLLVIDRFDIATDGTRMGFEDVASLMGLRVRDALSERKYRGSYENIAAVLRMINLPSADLARFFEQIAFSAMVRNGDGHLKNFGVLYGNDHVPRLSPMFDVVTTSIYKYQRFEGGPDMEDMTMALKLFAGKRGSKVYPTPAELLEFGKRICGVERPHRVVERIADAMRQALLHFKADSRMPAPLRRTMAEAWAPGLMLAAEATRHHGTA